MSFGINGPSGPEKLPAIQKSHHANDGGAGNLGYFQQEKNKNKKKKEENDTVDFSSKKEEKDEFIKEKELDSIGTKIKNLWLKINIFRHQT